MIRAQRFDADEIYRWVEAQAALGPRRPGTAAGRRQEEDLEAKLRDFGLEDVRAEPIPIAHWEAREASLRVAPPGGELAPVEAFPIPYAVFTPEDGVQAPLVYADSRRLFNGRDRERWRGAVVVTEIRFPDLDVNLLLRIASGVYDPDGSARLVDHPATWVRVGWHIYREAAAAGAVGFVGVLSDQPGGSGRMFAPYGFKEKDILDKPLPGFWVGRHAGDRLLALTRAGGASAHLRTRGIREPGLTHNVVGEIPGETDECVVLSCHHDSPFDSPVEDASGVAVVLALARHFARRRAEGHGLARRLVVLLSAGHFYGSIGTRTFIREHPEVVRRTALEISIEHVGLEAVEDASGQLVPTGRPEATGLFVPFSNAVTDALMASIEEAALERCILLPAEGPLGPYPPTDGGDWWEAGVPVINHISNPVYLLTDDDDLRWVDRPRLARVAEAFASVIRRLDAVPRRDIGAVDAPRKQLLMKLLRHVAYAKTTRFGRQPVY